MDRHEKLRILNKNLARSLAHILDLYINMFSLPFGKAAVRKLLKESGVFEVFETDKSIEKLEEAKNSLNEALSAVDQLQVSAEINKKEAEEALRKLKELQKSKASLEEEHEQVKILVKHDITALRKISGIPSEKERRHERYIGFASGVVASLVASGVIALGIWLI